MPLDQYDRRIDYLRISLTDHCNLRCVYCMPLDGLKFAAKERLLTADEIATVVRAAVGVGFRKFRLTGGEPTLRADLVEIIRRIASTPGVGDLGMTTNGILLPKLAGDLYEAGLKRVNIHVDTLNGERLGRLMRLGEFEKIWAGVEAAESVGMRPIKINCVVTAGYNDRDVADMAALTLRRDWHVRFIELMPLGGGQTAQVAIDRFVPNAETRRRIEQAHGALAPLTNGNPSDESKNYRLPGGRGVVGFISPVSEPYCGNCNRMRLTADGRFHLCLLNDDELDVRRALRAGGGTEAVREIVLRAVHHKPTGHHLAEGRSVRRRQMFQIGG